MSVRHPPATRPRTPIPELFHQTEIAVVVPDLDHLPLATEQEDIDARERADVAVVPSQGRRPTPTVCACGGPPSRYEIAFAEDEIHPPLEIRERPPEIFGDPSLASRPRRRASRSQVVTSVIVGETSFA